VRRLFWTALGAAAGVLIVRRVSQTAQRFSPEGVAGSLAGSLTGALGGLTEAVRDFAADVREGMAEREHELRAGLGLDGSHDAVDADGL
jgi:hypothetical protein